MKSLIYKLTALIWVNCFFIGASFSFESSMTLYDSKSTISTDDIYSNYTSERFDATTSSPNPSFNPRIITKDALCNGDNSGVAKIYIGITPRPITVIWNDGDSARVRTDLMAGNYSVTVTNGIGEVYSETISIGQPHAISAKIGVLASVCSLNSSSGTLSVIDLVGIAPFSYNWSNGANTQSISNLNPGRYFVTITDASGCSIVKKKNVWMDCKLSPIVKTTSAKCFGEANGRVKITIGLANRPLLFQWSDGSVKRNRTNLPAGNHIISITDASGQLAVDTITIEQPNPMVASFSNYNTRYPGILANGTSSIVVTGGNTPYTYNWSGGQNTSSVQGLNVGVYSCTVTDANGCTKTFSTSVGSNYLINPRVKTTMVSCNGSNNGAIRVFLGVANTPTSTIWNDGFVGKKRSNLAAGNYSFTITDALGQTYSDTIEITEPQIIAVTNSTIQNVTTQGGVNGQINLGSITGGNAPYTIHWSNGAIGDTILTGLSQGNYSATITDNNSCSVVENFTINQPTCGPLTSGGTISGGDTIWCQISYDGLVSSVSSPTGGSGIYKYKWFKSRYDSVYTGPVDYDWDSIQNEFGSNYEYQEVYSTNYFIRVAYDSVCPQYSDTSNFTKVEVLVTPYVTDGYNSVEVSCAGKNDGEIEVSLLAGLDTNDYIFEWSNGFSGGATLTGTAGIDLFSGQGWDFRTFPYPNVYSVKITARNNPQCTEKMRLIYSIEYPNTSNEWEMEILPGTCFGGGITTNGISLQDTSISSTSFVTGFSWSHDSTVNTNVLSGLANGTYDVTVSSYPSCSTVYSATIECSDTIFTNTEANLNSSGINRDNGMFQNNNEDDPENQNGVTISVFPNPSSDGKFNFKIESQEDEELRVTIYDMLGREVMSVFNGQINSFEILELQNQGVLKRGTYFIMVSGSNSSTYNRIIVR